MCVKSILVPLSSAELAEGTLKAAISMAKAYRAHVEVLHVQPDARMISAIYTETMSAENVEAMIRTAERNAAEEGRRIRDVFDRICKSRAIGCAASESGTGKATIEWHEEIGYEDQRLLQYGRATDLIVMGHPSVEGVGPSLALETALMNSGRPVLMVPRDPLTKTIGSNVAIAWNGSAESARAVAEAKPFLKKARKVTILIVQEPKVADCDSERVRRFLGWHGVSADITKLRPHGDVAKTLLNAAEKGGANLLVMGAYSHSRLRQLVFGGVTQYMLRGTKLPILMMH